MDRDAKQADHNSRKSFQGRVPTRHAERPLEPRSSSLDVFFIGKSLFYLLQLSSKFGFPPTTIKPGISPPSTFQTVHFTSLERFWRLFATVTIVLSFSFLKKFQLNLWKIIVNHKIENPILLDSTWVDIRSEYIIWYTLV